MTRISERFPEVNNLVFTMWGFRDNFTIPQYTFCSLTGYEMTKMHWDFNALLQEYHAKNAAEDDYIFRDANGELVDFEDLERAETMDMYTGWKSSNDREVWLRCRKNNTPRSMFVTMAAYEKMPEAETAKLHPLVQKYPTIFDFVAIGRPPLQQKFRECGLELASEQDAFDLLNDTWYNLTDGMLTYTRDNEPCTPEEADVISIALRTTAEKAMIRCVANFRKPPEWFGNLQVVTTEREYAKVRQFPYLLGFMGALINAQEQTVERIRLGIHKLVGDPDVFHRYQDDLQNNYRTATDDAFEFCDRHHLPCAEKDAAYLHYHTGLFNKANGAEILLIVHRNAGAYSQPWSAETASYIPGFTIADTSDLYPGVPAKNYIFAWANFEQGRGRTFADMIVSLKSKAMDEPWDFRDEDTNSILANYIQYTVARLLRIEDIMTNATRRERTKISERMGYPVVYNPEKTVAVLNTGLYTKQYKQLLLVFSRVNVNAKWVYRDVTYPGSHMLHQFNVSDRPCAPVYWDNAQELIYPFDYSKSAKAQRPDINMEHIMNRMERMPPEFLKDAIGTALRGDDCVGELTGLVDKGDYYTLKVRCREIPEIADEIERRIETEMERALECQNLNFRYIIPTFYPTMEKLCFLMPLRLFSRNAPDTALVISVDGTGDDRHLFGRTIVTMDMAYRDSRLLCKPEAEWLNPKDIIDTDKSETPAPVAAPAPAAAPVADAAPVVDPVRDTIVAPVEGVPQSPDAGQAEDSGNV